MIKREPPADLSAFNAPELLALSQSFFRADAVGADAAHIVAALLIAGVAAYPRAFTLREFAQYVMANDLDRCVTILLRRDEKLPVVALVLTREFQRWSARRRAACLDLAGAFLRLAALLDERPASSRRQSFR